MPSPLSSKNGSTMQHVLKSKTKNTTKSKNVSTIICEYA